SPSVTSTQVRRSNCVPTAIRSARQTATTTRRTLCIQQTVWKARQLTSLRVTSVQAGSQVRCPEPVPQQQTAHLGLANPSCGAMPQQRWDTALPAGAMFFNED